MPPKRAAGQKQATAPNSRGRPLEPPLLEYDPPRDQHGSVVLTGIVIDAAGCKASGGRSTADRDGGDAAVKALRGRFPLAGEFNVLFNIWRDGAPLLEDRMPLLVRLPKMTMPTLSPLAVLTVLVPVTGEAPFVSDVALPASLSADHAIVLNCAYGARTDPPRFSGNMTLVQADAVVDALRPKEAGGAYSILALARAFEPAQGAPAAHPHTALVLRASLALTHQSLVMALRAHPSYARAAEYLEAALEAVGNPQLERERGLHVSNNERAAAAYRTWLGVTTAPATTAPRSFADVLATNNAPVNNRCATYVRRAMHIAVAAPPYFASMEFAALCTPDRIRQIRDLDPKLLLEIRPDNMPVVFDPHGLPQLMQEDAILLREQLRHADVMARLVVPDVRRAPRYTQWPPLAMIGDELRGYLGEAADTLIECGAYHVSERPFLGTDDRLPPVQVAVRRQLGVARTLVVRYADQLSFKEMRILLAHMHDFDKELRVVLLGNEYVPSYNAQMGGSAYTLVRVCCGLAPFPLAPDTLFSALVEHRMRAAGELEVGTYQFDTMLALLRAHGAETRVVPKLELSTEAMAAEREGALVFVADGGTASELSQGAQRIEMGSVVATPVGPASIVATPIIGTRVIARLRGTLRDTTLRGAETISLSLAHAILNGMLPVSAWPGRVWVFVRGPRDLRWTALMAATLVPPERFTIVYAASSSD